MAQTKIQEDIEEMFKEELFVQKEEIPLQEEVKEELQDIELPGVPEEKEEVIIDPVEPVEIVTEDEVIKVEAEEKEAIIEEVESQIIVEKKDPLEELKKILKESMENCDINYKLRIACQDYFDVIGESYINTSGDLVNASK